MDVAEGKCPLCGNELKYGSGEISDNNIYSYKVSCKACSFSGLEFYTMCFVGFTADDGKEYNVK